MRFFTFASWRDEQGKDVVMVKAKSSNTYNSCLLAQMALIFVDGILDRFKVIPSLNFQIMVFSVLTTQSQQLVLGWEVASSLFKGGFISHQLESSLQWTFIGT